MPEVYKTPTVSMSQDRRICGIKGLEYDCVETCRKENPVVDE